MTEPGHQRISDAERHEVAELLRRAAGDGRIDLAELDERLDAAYAARTYADLTPITHDLLADGEAPTSPVPARRDPGVAPSVPGQPPPSRRAERHVAVMSGFERGGVWTVPDQMTIAVLMGGADVDLRRARFSGAEAVITVSAVMGGAQITVGPDVEVVMEGVGVMGGFAGPRGGADLPAGAPVLRVRGFAFWGGVSVERKELDRE